MLRREGGLGTHNHVEEAGLVGVLLRSGVVDGGAPDYPYLWRQFNKCLL